MAHLISELRATDASPAATSSSQSAVGTTLLVRSGPEPWRRTDERTDNGARATAAPLRLHERPWSERVPLDKTYTTRQGWLDWWLLALVIGGVFVMCQTPLLLGRLRLSVTRVMLLRKANIMRSVVFVVEGRQSRRRVMRDLQRWEVPNVTIERP